MEYCKDGDLEMYLKNYPKISEEDAVEILR